MDKELTDRVKTIAPKSSATIIPADDKSKSTNIPANKQDGNGSNITKKTDIHNDETPGNSTGGFNKSTVTVIKSK